MEQREQALREALLKNGEEAERWERYRKENETAIENLDMFGKRLTVDVMVPMGRKAYIPGKLVHTNEVLVGHYQGYFSQCSAHKAKDICELRIRKAQEQLKQLETEAELWQNKLEKPYTEGVLPNAEGRDIIEEYDEEKEKRWREEHKVRVKQAKMRERQEREQHKDKAGNVKVKDADKEQSDLEILKMLEDKEIMEELEQELDDLKVNEATDDTLSSLLAGEMTLPVGKSRTAHAVADQLPGVVKKTELVSNEVASVPATNNNLNPNPELRSLANDAGNDSDDSEADSLLSEVQTIKDQAKFLSAVDQIGFYEYQVEILKEKMRKTPLRHQQGVDERIRLMTLLDSLEDLLEQAEEAVGADELAALNAESDKEAEEQTVAVVESGANDGKRQHEKRRISFALEDNQTIEFCKTDAVEHMLPRADGANKQKIKPKRDIISLDEHWLRPTREQVSALPQTAADKQQTILKMVEQNVQYVSEHQSKQDFDLVNKILDSSVGRTLHISFRHSEQTACAVESEPTTHIGVTGDENVPGTPSDLYNMYLKMLECQRGPTPKTVFVNAYEGEDQVRTQVLREKARQQAYEDPRKQFSKLQQPTTVNENSTKSEQPNESKKSILRNKAAVQSQGLGLTNNNVENKQPKKKKKKSVAVDEGEYMSAYDKVMNEVVEKPLTEPEPLPKGNYIDAHAPKKRVSHFKQMRASVQRT